LRPDRQSVGSLAVSSLQAPRAAGFFYYFLLQRLNTNDGKHLHANMHTGGRSHKRPLPRHHSTRADGHGDGRQRHSSASAAGQCAHPLYRLITTSISPLTNEARVALHKRV
jgi:hypothetical protein